MRNIYVIDEFRFENDELYFSLNKISQKNKFNLLVKC